MKTETENKEMLTLTSLKERGWTDGTIKKLLGNPDLLKTNPNYRSAAPMRLYDLERVEKAETNLIFIEQASKKAERSARGSAVADKRRAELVAEADSWEIQFFALPDSWSKLKTAAIDAKENWFLETGQSEWVDRKDLDSGTLHRWCQNYLRHECSNYEELISLGRGRPGVYEVYSQVIRPKVDKRVTQIISGLKNKE